jgi:methionine-rich copper-binding protein CopC
MDLTGDIGQSVDISLYAEDVLEARLTTAQNDTVTWEMSADGGSNWQAVLPDGIWNQIAFSGNEFLWRSTHTPVNLRSNPTCTSLQFDFLFEFPQIDTVEDIPNDQGRRARITWLRSANDFVGSTTPIIEYAIYREIDNDLLISGGTDGEARELMSSPFYPPGDWDFIMTAPACAEDEYAVVVTTLTDSTISEGMYYTTFFVRALTDTPGIYFDSPVDSGYSVDNLAPAAPLNLEMASPTDLVWEESEAEDFDYFTVYGSATSEFDETATLVGYTIGITMDVTGDRYGYYHVTATDFSGNEGDASSVENTHAGILDVEKLPTVFALRQNKPNPFESSTVVRFDVPRPSDLSIKIYDAEGRLVRILAQGKTKPGRHAVAWNGVDSDGNTVSPGIYFIKMEATGFTATRKVTLLR